jgi:hypothetical protein
MYRSLLLSAFLSVSIGCGGQTAASGPGVDAGRKDSTGNDSQTATEADTKPASAPWSPVCPASAPTEGSSCTLNNLNCEYGCGNVLVCVDGTWGGAIGSPFCQDGKSPLGCPPAISSINADGGACTGPVTGACVYPTEVCECVSPFDPTPDASSSWWCGPGVGCPMPRPRIGSACTSAGQSCSYAECGSTETCMGGYWQGGDEPCGGG